MFQSRFFKARYYNAGYWRQGLPSAEEAVVPQHGVKIVLWEVLEQLAEDEELLAMMV